MNTKETVITECLCTIMSILSIVLGLILLYCTDYEMFDADEPRSFLEEFNQINQRSEESFSVVCSVMGGLHILLGLYGLIRQELNQTKLN